MSTITEKPAKASGGRLTRRYWRRTDSAAPWYPWGIVQLLWLVFLLVLGAMIIAPRIEADVKSNVANRLDGVGVSVTELRADGQIVSITANSAETNKSALQAIADSTKCQTWAGRLPCPTAINVTMIQSAEQPVAAESRSHRFMIERTEDSVTLSGEVPSRADEQRILDTAGRYFSDVTNRLSVSNEIANEGYMSGSNLAITTASHLTQGHSQWDGESLSVLGFASVDQIDLARQQFDQIGDRALRGEFNIHALETGPSNNQCNDEFAAQLGESDIRFSTSSADIDASSDALLEALAKLALDCPGNMVIEGHTDSRGDAVMNKSLSQARANSVLAALINRGVNADRLRATGFGEEQPIANNETADGRAENRRITINVQENN